MRSHGEVGWRIQVCIVLRMMAEEVTQYRDDLEADNKRQLLSALTACVPQVLPFLESSMEGHFGQALAAAQQGQQQLSQLHAAVVTAALGGLTVACWTAETLPPNLSQLLSQENFADMVYAGHKT